MTKITDFTQVLRISMVGSGQVATHLALQLHHLGHDIVQIVGRNVDKAQQLATQVSATAIVDYALFCPQVDLIFIAVQDAAIEQVAQQLQPYLHEHHILLHTSGSTDLQKIQQYHTNAVVFYPLQTFSVGREIAWHNVPLLLEFANKEQQQSVCHLAAQISQRCYEYSSQQRLSLHLAAVVACNFSNFCYDLAYQFMRQQQVDFQLLTPLILETAQKATLYPPHQVQTGPARRQDQSILAQHQQLLAQLQQQDLAQVYALMSDLIQKRHTVV
ncbi:MAG: F420-dependent NADP oxidoreductase [Acinetobacter sp.]|nr:F420-dependent NADP oxidoreductase [Acinetobacter sp.]